MTVIAVEDHQLKPKRPKREATKNKKWSKRRARKATQQQQQIISVCLHFGQSVMCAFDSQHVKLCSLLLCEIFSVAVLLQTRCVIVVVLLLLLLPAIADTQTLISFHFHFISFVLFLVDFCCFLSLSPIGDLDYLYFSWCQSIYLPCCWRIFFSFRCSRSSIVCCVYRFIYLHNELLWPFFCACAYMRVECKVSMVSLCHRFGVYSSNKQPMLAKTTAHQTQQNRRKIESKPNEATPETKQHTFLKYFNFVHVILSSYHTAPCTINFNFSCVHHTVVCSGSIATTTKRHTTIWKRRKKKLPPISEESERIVNSDGIGIKRVPVHSNSVIHSSVWPLWKIKSGQRGRRSDTVYWLIWKKKTKTNKCAYADG